MPQNRILELLRGSFQSFQPAPPSTPCFLYWSPTGIKLLDFFKKDIYHIMDLSHFPEIYVFFNLPTTLTGFLWGSNPKVYWKIPRPWKRTGAKATFFWIFIWMSRNLDPRGLLTWLKRSFSPKANTGTREALRMENINSDNILYMKWSKCLFSWLQHL